MASVESDSIIRFLAYNQNITFLYSYLGLPTTSTNNTGSIIAEAHLSAPILITNVAWTLELSSSVALTNGNIVAVGYFAQF